MISRGDFIGLTEITHVVGDGTDGAPVAPKAKSVPREQEHSSRGPPGSKHELGARRGAAVGERIVGCVSGDPRVGERAQGGELHQCGSQRQPPPQVDPSLRSVLNASHQAADGDSARRSSPLQRSSTRQKFIEAPSMLVEPDVLPSPQRALDALTRAVAPTCTPALPHESRYEEQFSAREAVFLAGVNIMSDYYHAVRHGELLQLEELQRCSCFSGDARVTAIGIYFYY